jgi:hypothetical protein
MYPVAGIIASAANAWLHTVYSCLPSTTIPLRSWHRTLSEPLEARTEGILSWHLHRARSTACCQSCGQQKEQNGCSEFFCSTVLTCQAAMQGAEHACVRVHDILEHLIKWWQTGAVFLAVCSNSTALPCAAALAASAAACVRVLNVPGTNNGSKYL